MSEDAAADAQRRASPDAVRQRSDNPNDNQRAQDDVDHITVIMASPR
jgi:hypothetical protein